MTIEEFEADGYKLLPSKDGDVSGNDVQLLCWGEPVTANWCAEHCMKYHRCQNIADMDDALKELDGEE